MSILFYNLPLPTEWAYITGAGPGAGAGPAPANIYMLSEHCNESGAGTPDGSRGWQVEALVERSAEEQLEELISAHLTMEATPGTAQNIPHLIMEETTSYSSDDSSSFNCKGDSSCD